MSESPIARLLADGPRAVNLGVEQFAGAVRPFDPGVVSVDWRPPSGGEAVVRALNTLSEPAIAARVEAANARVVAGLIGARPYLVDVRPAREMVPALSDRVLLHAGPPLTYAEMTGPMPWKRLCCRSSLVRSSAIRPAHCAGFLRCRSKVK